MNERVLNVAALSATALAFGSAPALAAPATDGPGAMSHFALARKDCVGTALNDRSKVWFTVADGVLSDVYYPTNDNTNNETLQYVVTDGSTFTDLQTRDMTYTVQALDKRALTCRVVAKAKSGRYRITTDFLTDPNRPTVILHCRFEALKGRTRDYRVYARFDPNLNGNGGGGAGNGGADTGRHAGQRAGRLGHRDRDQRGQPRLRAARVLRPRRRLHPGLQRLRGRGQRRAQAARRQPQAHRASSPTPRPATSSRPGRSTLGHDGTFTLALGFGSTAAQAVGTAKSTLRDAAVADRAASTCSAGTTTTTAWSSRRRPRNVSPRRLGRPAGHLLPERELRQGGHRQDVPGRHRPPRWPPRGARRSPPAIRPTPTSAPTARSSAATSTRPGPPPIWPATSSSRRT